jgi:hypothetical protein
MRPAAIAQVRSATVRQNCAERTEPSLNICRTRHEEWSFSDDLNQHPFSTAAVEFAIEDLFPGAEIQFAFGDRGDDLAAHDLALEVSIRIILAGPIVLILRGRRVGRQFLEPNFVIVF